MFIWQYVDIPQVEIEKIQQEYRDNLPNNEIFFQHIKLKRTHFLDMQLTHTVLIQTHPWYGMKNETIHTDIITNGSNLVLNIPLDNCAGSFTKFWKTDRPVVTRHTVNGGYTHSFFQAKDCEQISQAELSKPFIFDSQVPHCVTNPQDVWRRAISLRFKYDPRRRTKLI
jgi:hypothetical protein